MNAPDQASGAARQSRRAVSCIWVLTAVALTAVLVWPSDAGFSRNIFNLTLAVAGFAATRLLLIGPAGPRGGLEAAARMALWVALPLAAVCGGTVLAGLLLLPPAELADQARMALWTVLGVSGPELVKQGLWAPAFSEDLLLHGWVIGVAAQLTLGWGVVVLVLRRLGWARGIGPVAFLGLVLSLVVIVWMRGHGAEPHAFYLAPPRAWAFLAGAMLASHAGPPVPDGPNRVVAALTRLSPFALPFYLWVWPLLTLPRLILARPLSLLEIAVALTGAALLAWATTRWIDQPLRRRLEARPGRALGACGAMLAAVAMMSGAIWATGGVPERASAAVRAEEARARVRPPLQAACNTEEVGLPPENVCTMPGSGAADVVLWGNSHASHISPALLDWAAARGLRVRQATRSGCLPLLTDGTGLASADCVRFNRAAVDEWSRMKPWLIVVGAGWTTVLEQIPAEDRVGPEVLEADLWRMLRALRARVGPETRIVLLGNTPDYGFDPAVCHARRAFLRLDTERCDQAVPANAVLAAQVDDGLTRIAAATPGVTVFRPAAALCEGGSCRTRGVDGPWYLDRNHLTEAGGRAQTPALSAVLDRALADR